MSLVEEEGLAEEEEATEEEGSEEEEDFIEEEGAPMPRRESWARTSRSLTSPPVRPMFEVSTVIEDDIARIWEMYQITKDFHLHVSRLEDWVTSSPADYLAMYEEDLHAGLHFPLHSLI